jgi:hypothetical protein
MYMFLVAAVMACPASDRWEALDSVLEAAVQGVDDVLGDATSAGW